MLLILYNILKVQEGGMIGINQHLCHTLMCDSCLWNACYLADLTPSGISLSLGLLQTGLWSRADEHRELLYKQWFMGHKHSFTLSFTIPIWYLHIVDMKYNIYMSKTMFVSLSFGRTLLRVLTMVAYGFPDLQKIMKLS